MLDIGIFVDTPTIQYHLGECKQLKPLSWNVYTHRDNFLSSTHAKKFAVLHFPYPFDDDFSAEVQELSSKCTHVFIVGSELHRITVDFMREHDQQNITYFICGQLNFKLEHSEVLEYYDWFETSRYFYRDYLPEILQRLKPGPKPRQFDMLLGRKKPHRDAIYSYARTNLRVEDYCLSYFQDHAIDFSEESWIWPGPGLRLPVPVTWTVETVEYYGHRMSLSQVIPLDVYNQTNYSIVAETNYSNSYSFYTEKTAKPIIARRLFVMFAGQHYLRNLRKLGFKTFHGIINESYDSIEDDALRWQMACQQLSKLKAMNASEVLAQAQPIVDHNFSVMMRTEWFKGYVSQLEHKLDALAQQT